MQQNETIVKKYLDSNDLYFHADYHGAPSVVLKNPERRVVGEASLSQAAQYSVALSKAWSDKVVCSAYYVFASQVSKTAPSGEYLPTGSFMVRGKKNYVAPSRVTLGLGMLYVVKEKAIENVDFVIPPVQEQQAQPSPQKEPSCEVVSSTSVRSILCDDESENENEDQAAHESADGDKDKAQHKEQTLEKNSMKQPTDGEIEEETTGVCTNNDASREKGKKRKPKREVKTKANADDDEVFCFLFGCLLY